MKARLVLSAVLTLVSAGHLAAADEPFMGAWKLNLTKSKLAGDLVKFEEAPGGAIKQTAAGISSTFKTDGRDYPAPFGRVVAWKQVNDHTWESVLKHDGKPFVTATTQLSADGRVMRQ